MSYLDDIDMLFGSDDGDASEVMPARTTLETVRDQLEDMNHYFVEGPEGVFTADGTRRGCGYVTVTCVVDEEAGTCSVDINTHIKVAPEHARAASRMMRMLNNTFIQTGLQLDESNIVHFVVEGGVDVRSGGEVDTALSRGLSTVHNEAHKFTALAAGVEAWNLI